MRVVLADDATLIRDGLARLLTDAGIEVVGVGSSGDDALKLVEETAPDVAIVDIRMPPTGPGEGLRLAPIIRSQSGGRTGVLILSQFLEVAFALKMLSGGASGVGYLLKDRVADVDALVDALERVAGGGSVIDPAVVAELLDRSKPRALDDLTNREKTVLSLMAEGRSNHAIAEELVVTPKTVEAHVASIFSKLLLAPTADDHRRVLAVLAYLDSR